MIFNDGIESCIESIYLGEGLSTRTGLCNIHVNPSEVSYIINKTIVINMPGYSTAKILGLLERRNRVICRVQPEDKSILGRVNFEPYIMRLNLGMQWNGEILNYPSTESDPLKWLSDISCSVGSGLDSIKLYFPKIYNLPGSIIYDKYDNLSCLGWALHQVGINTEKGSKYVDLDLLKTFKIF